MPLSPDQRPQQSKSRLDALQKMLYRRDGKIPHIAHDVLTPHHYDVNQEWQKRPDTPPDPLLYSDDTAEKARGSFFWGLLLFSVVFFAAATGFGAYIFLGGNNTVSTDNLDVSIIGPVAVPAGEPLSLTIAANNKNNADLQSVKLIVQYPDGTKSVTSPANDFPRDYQDIGTIGAGKTARLQSQAILYGSENSIEQVQATVEYQIAGSGATFYKNATYSVTLSSAPVAIRVSSTQEAISGEPFTLTAEVASNSNAIIRNVLVKVDYPFGFTAGDMSPKPTYGNTTWDLGDLAPGSKRIIKISGKIDGQDGDQRVFRFSVGTQSDKDERMIGTNFLSQSQTVAVQKPFISVAISLDGDSSPVHAALPGASIRTDIAWANNLTADVTDAKIEVKLLGDLIDRNSVTVSGGYFRSVDNTVVWDKSTKPEFADLSAGSQGTVSFTFQALPVTSAVAGKAPQVGLNAQVSGHRISERGNVPEAINSADSRVVQLTTSAKLMSRAVYTVGPFTNIGPIPPQADHSTSYTIVWSLTNGFNPISGGKVVAKLPTDVTWLGVVSPKSEKVSYNQIGGTVTWDVGDLAANAGATNGPSPREVSFQISYLPSLSQVGSRQHLMEAASFDGTDSYTGADVSASQDAVTTVLSTDPGFVYGQEKVVR